MTEQIIALAIAMGASESQREVLEPLCAAAEQALTAQLAERRDLELFARQLMRADGGISMLRMARLLQDAGIRTGRTRMMAWMRQQGYLCRSQKEDNIPTQRGMALGLFVVEESLYAPRPGVVLLNQATRVTPKGQPDLSGGG